MVFPYDSRNAQLSSNSLRLRGAIAKGRFHAIAISALDRAAQVVRIEISVALRGREVRVPRELLDGCGPYPVPEKLRYEEVPQIAARLLIRRGLRCSPGSSIRSTECFGAAFLTRR